uniref:DNA polymerase I (DPA, polB1) n=4 Tax=environmental samples TaxID=651140 RepID=A0A075I3X4_9ARCH|nr:DNA polymerase I (DPA, polB1) [uncultured marine thaumarchaeote SAT1000_09_B07]AIF22354.1 DNA polymerase I (DPA, polB1) [uncultured marine thaumarchaeote SAT1000_09_B08]AIF22412.1 DNA polymerase I (DPA, polB1) [uncultured marine thaumarchaeote SAT1000_09_C07]AIF22470.1 DNA polymerase I (DPA, polB1) [uncultured marine thaumarchaeote SAT1000_09_C08]
MLLDKQSDTNLPDPKQFDEHVSQWANLLNQPIPKIKRISLDIEVESEIGRIPDPKIAEKNYCCRF